MNGPFNLDSPEVVVDPAGCTKDMWLYQIIINRRPAFTLKVHRVSGLVVVTNREEQEAIVTHTLNQPAARAEVQALVDEFWPALLAIAYLN